LSARRLRGARRPLEHAMIVQCIVGLNTRPGPYLMTSEIIAQSCAP
jgi:hypothetical protein